VAKDDHPDKRGTSPPRLSGAPSHAVGPVLICRAGRFIGHPVHAVHIVPDVLDRSGFVFGVVPPRPVAQDVVLDQTQSQVGH
jgi:hypothetical protein